MCTFTLLFYSRKRQHSQDKLIQADDFRPREEKTYRRAVVGSDDEHFGAKNIDYRKYDRGAVDSRRGDNHFRDNNQRQRYDDNRTRQYDRRGNDDNNGGRKPQDGEAQHPPPGGRDHHYQHHRGGGRNNNFNRQMNNDRSQEFSRKPYINNDDNFNRRHNYTRRNSEGGNDGAGRGASAINPAPVRRNPFDRKFSDTQRFEERPPTDHRDRGFQQNNQDRRQWRDRSDVPPQRRDSDNGAIAGGRHVNRKDSSRRARDSVERRSRERTRENHHRNDTRNSRSDRRPEEDNGSLSHRRDRRR